jgi:hypothetical protein
MHNNDWLQRNKVIKPGTARSGMQAAGTKTQELREKNAKNQHFVSTGCLTQTIKNGNVVKTNFQIKKSIAPQKQTIQTILEKNSKQISVIATNSKVDNQQAKRLKPRLCHSLAGDNNPNNNLNKAETDAKVNNAKINSKNNERIKIQ